MGHSSRSTRSASAEDAPVCLEPTYAARRLRTVQLVKRSVDLLLAEGARISLSSVAARSKMTDVDPLGKGVSESAILNNADARASYERHRSWVAENPRRTMGRTRRNDAPSASTLRIAGDRDIHRAERRYVRWQRSALAERLVLVEQAYSAQERYIANLASQLFTWMLLADRFLQRSSLQSSHTEETR